MRLTKEWVNKIAQVANDGFARTIKPVHSLFDGDSILYIKQEMLKLTF